MLDLSFYGMLKIPHLFHSNLSPIKLSKDRSVNPLLSHGDKSGPRLIIAAVGMGR